MNWLTRAITLKPRVWAMLCWQRVLGVYIRAKQALTYASTESAQDTDLRIARNAIIAIVAQVVQMRIDYVL